MKFKGIQQTINKLRRLGHEGENKIKQVTAVAANELATKAAQNLSSYTDADPTGTIAQSINAQPKNDGLTWTIAVNQVPMGAYLEFGTGTFVDIPAGWEKIAWQFYINGQGTLKPRPYLYPAYYEVRRQYKKDLKDALNQLVNRYNNS